MVGGFIWVLKFVSNSNKYIALYTIVRLWYIEFAKKPKREIGRVSALRLKLAHNS